jgi:uncharacterized phage protein gp47/JayE
MPFPRPTPIELRDRLAAEMEAAFTGADARRRRSVEEALVRMVAAASHEAHGHLAWNVRQLLPSTADADELETRHGYWGRARLPATAAGGEVTFTGSSGAVVPAGTELRRADGTRYILQAAVTLLAGTGTGTVTAAVAGAAGNAAAATGLSLVSPVTGVSATAQVAAGGLGAGRDLEDVESLRARIVDRVQKPPHGGNENDYKTWVEDVIGDTTVWVAPLQLGPSTVVVRFLEPDGALPNAATVAAVQSYIDLPGVRPVTAIVTVVAPTALLVPLTIAVVPKTPAVQAAVEAELTAFFIREGEPGGTIWLSRLREAISRAAGETRHALSAPVADVVQGAGEVARLGAITWL